MEDDLLSGHVCFPAQLDRSMESRVNPRMFRWGSICGGYSGHRPSPPMARLIHHATLDRHNTKDVTTLGMDGLGSR